MKNSKVSETEKLINLEIILNNIPDIFIRFDRDYNILFFNQNIRNLIENQNLDNKNISFSDLPKELSDFLKTAYNCVFNEGRNYENEILIEYKKNRKIFGVRVIPENTNIGEIFNAICICRDITEYREYKQNYRALFESMLDGFALHEMMYDENGEAVDYKFLLVNPAFEKLTGLKKEEVLNKRVLDIMPDLEKEWIVIYDTVARTGKSERFEMYSAPLKKYFEVAAYSPRKGQFACIFQDVTLKKYFEKEVIINDRLAALGQLSFGIAHEFNNILAIIKGNAQLLSMTCENLDEEQRELLKTIDEQVIRAADISGKMMNFSATRPAARKNENIVDVIKEIMIIQKNYLMMDNIELIFEIEKEKFSDDQDYMVFIDVNQIKLTLINMIMNARDAIIMKKNTDGIVKIILTKDEKNIIIKIQDNGIGMDEKMKEKLFTPFYTTKGAFLQDEELENIKGVGLNLLICWTIIKIHNGQIIVDSELNEGTTFTIKLPYYIKPINR